MKKIFLTVFFLFVSSTLFFAQQTGEEPKDPYKPTPEKEIRTGLFSITGSLGPVFSLDEGYSTKSPYLKIGFHYNLNDFISISLGGGVTKYDGPSEFLIEKEGYYLSPDFLDMIKDNYYFGPSRFEESWYSAQITLRIIPGSFTPYIFGGVKYLSTNYSQEMFFEDKYSSQKLNTVWQVTLNNIAFFGGGGFIVNIVDYLDLFIEGEYVKTIDSDIINAKMAVSFGFRITI